MARIFLCHASEDKVQVRDVYQRLRAIDGFEPWLDEEDLLPGQDWDYEIKRALKASDFILIFLSQGSVAKRGYVQREMKLALDAWQEVPEGTTHTIPVRIDACDVPESFRRYHWTNLFEPNGFDRIIRAIRDESAKRQGESNVLVHVSQKEEVTRPCAKILLVEDNIVNQKIMTRLLQRLGYLVEVTENGCEALSALQRTTYDCIIMDVIMPIMDGFKATTAIRMRETRPGDHIPIIALTASTQIGDRERCLQSGMDAYLSKPVKIDELQTVLSNLVSPRPKCGVE